MLARIIGNVITSSSPEAYYILSPRLSERGQCTTCVSPGADRRRRLGCGAGAPTFGHRLPLSVVRKRESGDATASAGYSSIGTSRGRGFQSRGKESGAATPLGGGRWCDQRRRHWELLPAAACCGGGDGERLQWPARRAAKFGRVVGLP